jgi:hypothetical protein
MEEKNLGFTPYRTLFKENETIVSWGGRSDTMIITNKPCQVDFSKISRVMERVTGVSEVIEFFFCSWSLYIREIPDGKQPEIIEIIKQIISEK